MGEGGGEKGGKSVNQCDELIHCNILSGVHCRVHEARFF